MCYLRDLLFNSNLARSGDTLLDCDTLQNLLCAWAVKVSTLGTVDEGFLLSSVLSTLQKVSEPTTTYFGIAAATHVLASRFFSSPASTSPFPDRFTNNTVSQPLWLETHLHTLRTLYINNSKTVNQLS